MNNEQLLLMFSLSASAMAIGSIFACYQMAKKLRETRDNQQIMATDVNKRLSELHRTIESKTAKQDLEKEALDFAFSLPTRPVAAPARQNGGSAFASSVRESFTERRHRILTLAQRGLDIKTISARLGVPLGEVALIIRMSNPSYGD